MKSNKHIKRLYILLSWVLFISFMAIVLPYESNLLSEQTQMSESFDTSFFQTGMARLQMVEDYQEAGRNAYIISRFRFDILWPLVYGMAFHSLLWLFLRGKPSWMLYLPWIAVSLDLLENASVIELMLQYPQSSIVLAWISSFLTLFKWITILILPVAVVYVFIQSKKPNHLT
ncbi:MAG: hypothetical protein U1C51_02445 [Candidatus Izemoplasmatales bacterium]|nr:hypothetical protein [Candidatus Izemoplasmatales bacterium]